MDFNEFALDLLVDDREMDFLEDTPVFRPPASSSEVQKNIEFFFSPDMSCPIDGCPPALVLSTKAKYQRPWREKHLPEVISYSCPVFHCKVSCRRRYDMKAHRLRVHNTAKGLVESILSKSQRNSRPNGAFINPGMFTFYGWTSSSSDKDVLLLQTKMFCQCRWYRNL